MLRKAFWRSFTLYAAVSPAKQGASGFCYSLMPFINKFYKNDEEGKKAALTRSMSYFNTTITLSTFIMGLVASMEKKNSEQKDFDASSINAVKSSLMGPLAGIGDSIFWGVLRVIAAGIAVGLGMTGNILGEIFKNMLHIYPARTPAGFHLVIILPCLLLCRLLICQSDSGDTHPAPSGRHGKYPIPQLRQPLFSA